MNQLTVIESMNPIEIFSNNNMDNILAKIKEEALAQNSDISSDAGRKGVASLAYKIARSKTFLDDLGKGLGEDAQKKLNAINAERKKARDFLDSLKEEVRKPLTEWEGIEKARVAGHEKAIADIVAIGVLCEQNWQTLTAQQAIDKAVEAGLLINRDWQEFKVRAQDEIDKAIVKANVALKSIRDRQAEREELERLRAAEAERVQKERETQIAAKAAESAKLEAEQAAKAEADRVAAQTAKELQAAIREKILAEQNAFAAEKEQKAKAEADQKRELDKVHCAKVNNAILFALVGIGIDEANAKNIIFHIVSGKIPNTKITY